MDARRSGRRGWLAALAVTVGLALGALGFAVSGAFADSGSGAAATGLGTDPATTLVQSTPSQSAPSQSTPSQTTPPQTAPAPPGPGTGPGNGDCPGMGGSGGSGSGGSQGSGASSSNTGF
jgi:hypothetical protein